MSTATLPAVVNPTPASTPPSASPIVTPDGDICDTAETRLNEWVKANGGSSMAIGAPTPGTWIATIIAFLMKILPLLGCAIAAQKQMVMSNPNRARRRIAILAAMQGFSFADIPKVVDASMHLLTNATVEEYAAFAAAA